MDKRRAAARQTAAIENTQASMEALQASMAALQEEVKGLKTLVNRVLKKLES